MAQQYEFPSNPWSDVVVATPVPDNEIPTVEVVASRNAGAGAGGVADAWNRGDGSSSDSFMFGGPTNFDPVSGGSAQTNPTAAHYYQGYWAGVQAALYKPQSATNPFLSFGFTPPFSPFGAHSYGFATNVLQAIEQPPTQDLRSRMGAASRSIGSVGHPFEIWLTPDSGSWSFGNNADEWPADLPDWGDRPSGPLSPGFSPMSGDVRDIFPTEQEIQDAGNPALWLSPRMVGPMVPSLSSSGPGPDDMTPVFPPAPTTSTLIPFDITPGDTTSDVTPRGDWTD